LLPTHGRKLPYKRKKKTKIGDVLQVPEKKKKISLCQKRKKGESPEHPRIKNKSKDPKGKKKGASQGEIIGEKKKKSFPPHQWKRGEKKTSTSKTSILWERETKK